VTAKWQLVPLKSIAELHMELVNPADQPDQLFQLFSIPAFDTFQKPELQRGLKIGSHKFSVPKEAVLVSKLNPQFPRVWEVMVEEGYPALASTEFLVLRPRAGIGLHFLKYVCLSPVFLSQMQAMVTGTSGSHQRVSTKDILNIPVRVPPLFAQRIVAHILGTLDDKIELNRRMNETLEQMARAIFKSWLVDFDPVRAKMSGRWKKGESLPGLPAHLWDLFPDRLLPSELGDIPEGWKISDLHSIASFLNGLPLQNYPPKEGRGLPIIKISQLHNRNISGAEMASDDIDPEFIINNGDIIFSWSGSLECVLWTGGKGALNQHLFKVSSQSFPMWWVYFWIHQHLPAFRKIAAGKATTMGHIQRHHLEEAKIILPPDFIMEKADELISPLWLRLIQLSSQNSSLSGLRDILLPKLISGQIDLVKFCTSGET
jgi:type I restriction enzyme S subunit